jgi:hypothetical protein
MGERLTVQFARGSRHPPGAGNFPTNERREPRPRRTPHRMQIKDLPNDTSWQVCFPASITLFGWSGLSKTFLLRYKL